MTQLHYERLHKTISSICSRKYPYYSRQAAIDGQHNMKMRENLRAYLCVRCGLWHNGNMDYKHSRRRKNRIIRDMRRFNLPVFVLQLPERVELQERV